MRGPLKSIAERFGAAVKNNATKAVNEGSSFFFKNAESAYKTGKSAALETAARTASKQLEAAFKKGKDVTLNQVTAATAKASHVVTDASSNLVSTARTASREASHVVRDASVTIASSAKVAAKEAAVEAKNEAKRGIRWFMMWSLAAVGVYGVATTVSKELVRHALVGTKREDYLAQSKQAEESSQDGASANRSSWLWLPPTEPRTSAESNEGDVPGSGSRWSWLESWGRKSS